VLDDLNNGAGKPVQVEFTGADSRKLMEITNAYMDKLRQVPGAVDVTPVRAGSEGRAADRADRGLANSMGIAAGDAAQALRVAFAGIEVGDWVDPTGESRDVAVRLRRKTASPREASSACRSPSPAPTRWCRWTRSPPSPWARARPPSSTRMASG
jgi:multidrug efflux pump subunit AcrB